MHEQAILTTGNAAIGQPGKLVTIGEVLALYPTTAEANAGINYRCADPKCSVRVKAIIPVQKKASRKTSPSPYFAARWTPHLAGCTREPREVSKVTSTPVVIRPGNTSRLNVPVVWVDLQVQPSTSIAAAPAIPPKNQPTKGSSGGRSSGGTGTSSGQSQLVERFAEAWKSMTVTERNNTELRALWNAGGTYFSGFFPLAYHVGTAIETLGDQIFVGTFKSIIHGKSGYTITLSEKHPDGHDLRIWIQDVSFTVPPNGAGLENILEVFSKSSPTITITLYTFGSFLKQRSQSGNHVWYALPVTHPHQIWIDN